MTAGARPGAQRRRGRAIGLLTTALLMGAASGCSGDGTPAAPTSTSTSAVTSMSSPAASKPAATPETSTAGSTGARPARTHVVAARAGWRLPAAMSRAVAVPLGRGVVLAGGLLAGDVSTSRTYAITLPGGRVRRLGDLPLAVHDAAGGILRGRPAVLGGGGAAEVSDVQRLGGDGVWHRVGHLPAPRSDLSTVYDGQRVVVVGGYDGATSPRTVLESGDGRTFHRVGVLPHGVRYAAVAVLDGVAWVLGGEEDHQELRSVYGIDLATGRVAEAASLPRPTGHAAVTVVGDRLLLMGGRTAPDRPTDALWWFRPPTRTAQGASGAGSTGGSGTWRRAGRLPYPVADAASACTADGCYLMGGETPDFSDRVTRVTW